MSKRDIKKIVLLIIEGKSEDIALFSSLSKLFDQVDPQVELVAARIIENGETKGGDITTKFDNLHLNNIEDRINKYIISPNLAEKRFMKKDVVAVIQITDTDGTYISQDCIKEQHDVEQAYYDEDAIITSNIIDISERNRMKSNNLNYLSDLSTIHVQTKVVPYRIYYHSCNFDHCICGERNLDEKNKVDVANDFYGRYFLLKDFISFYKQSEFVAIGMTYEQSWEYIRTGNHSLSRFTNLNILIDDIQKGYFCKLD